jgi:outer membrane protein OmpA-like peptidoglycan-associated protein
MRLVFLVVMLALAGCASVKSPAPATPVPPGPPASPAEQRAAAPAALLVERQWLQSWFEGTPVRITQGGDGAVSVEVPREFCFDAGKTSIKPEIAAVLNRVAVSLRRVPASRLALLAAPDDAAGTSLLARVRGAQIARHLASRGVVAARIAKPTASAAPEVRLRIDGAAP